MPNTDGQNQAKIEGKVKIMNFNEMVKKYFKSKYGKDGDFNFLYVEYEFYDKDYKVLNLDLGKYISRPENRKVKDLLPFFIEPKSIDDAREFSLKIPGVIDISSLNSEISSHLPKGVTLITDNQIKELLFNEGYEEPFFDHYFYSMMDYPSYNLYAKPIIKDKNQSVQIVDNNTSEKLEKAYLDGSLKQTGIIDTENFPQNVSDDETSATLDVLFSNNQLPVRQVKYCIGSITEPIHITEYFNEYSFHDRKFIRCQAMADQKDVTLSNNNSINKDQFYWIEVMPTDSQTNKTLISDSSEKGKTI